MGEDPQTPQAEKKAGENPKARVWSKGESQPYPREKGMEAWPGYAGPGTKLERTPEDEGGGLGSAPPSQESSQGVPQRPKKEAWPADAGQESTRPYPARP